MAGRAGTYTELEYYSHDGEIPVKFAGLQTNGISKPTAAYHELNLCQSIQHIHSFHLVLCCGP